MGERRHVHPGDSEIEWHHDGAAIRKPANCRVTIGLKKWTIDSEGHIEENGAREKGQQPRKIPFPRLEAALPLQFGAIEAKGLDSRDAGQRPWRPLQEWTMTFTAPAILIAGPGRSRGVLERNRKTRKRR